MLDHDVELPSPALLSGLTSETRRELTERLTVLIEYSQEYAIPYQWTRRGYEDLSSMGRPFRVPDEIVNDKRPMTSLELADAICEVVTSVVLAEGSVRAMLYNTQDRCTRKQTSRDRRCMNCQGCCNYKTVVDHIRNINS